VTPERRSILPAHLNRLGVRNRFLLQLNNWDLSHGGMSLISGVLWRNVLVVVAVLVRERESLPALFDVVRLWTRARAIYRSTEKA
jgi:hypothetical protein